MIIFGREYPHLRLQQRRSPAPRRRVLDRRAVQWLRGGRLAVDDIVGVSADLHRRPCLAKTDFSKRCVCRNSRVAGPTQSYDHPPRAATRGTPGGAGTRGQCFRPLGERCRSGSSCYGKRRGSGFDGPRFQPVPGFALDESIGIARPRVIFIGRPNRSELCAPARFPDSARDNSLACLPPDRAARRLRTRGPGLR